MNKKEKMMRDKGFEWSPEHQAYFHKGKGKLISQHQLIYMELAAFEAMLKKLMA